MIVVITCSIGNRITTNYYILYTTMTLTNNIISPVITTLTSTVAITAAMSIINITSTSTNTRFSYH